MLCVCVCWTIVTAVVRLIIAFKDTHMTTTPHIKPNAHRWGEPLSLESELPKVDIIVVGSVAVDPATGARIGKGEGFMEVG